MKFECIPFLCSTATHLVVEHRDDIHSSKKVHSIPSKPRTGNEDSVTKPIAEKSDNMGLVDEGFQSPMCVTLVSTEVIATYAEVVKSEQDDSVVVSGDSTVSGGCTEANNCILEQEGTSREHLPPSADNREKLSIETKNTNWRKPPAIITTDHQDSARSSIRTSETADARSKKAKPSIRQSKDIVHVLSSRLKRSKTNGPMDEETNFSRVYSGGKLISMLRSWREGSSSNKTNKSKEDLSSIPFTAFIKEDSVLSMLMTFTSKLKCREMLELWMDLTKYHFILNKRYEMLGGDDSMYLSSVNCKDQALYIWSTYLMNDSPKWVCLNSSTYNNLKNRLMSSNAEYNTTLFCQVEEYVYSELQYRIAPLFVLVHRNRLLPFKEEFLKSSNLQESKQAVDMMASILSPRHTTTKAGLQDLYKYSPAWEAAMNVAKKHSLYTPLELWMSLQWYFKLKYNNASPRNLFRHVSWVYGMFLMPSACRHVPAPITFVEDVHRVIELARGKVADLREEHFRGVFKRVNGFITHFLENSLLRILEELHPNLTIAALNCSPTRHRRSPTSFSAGHHDHSLHFGLHLHKLVEKALYYHDKVRTTDDIASILRFEKHKLINPIGFANFSRKLELSDSNSALLLIYRFLSEIELMPEVNDKECKCLIHTIIVDYFEAGTEFEMMEANKNYVKHVLKEGEDAYFQSMFYPLQTEITRKLWSISRNLEKIEHEKHPRKQLSFFLAPFHRHKKRITTDSVFLDLSLEDISLEETLKHPIAFEMLYRFSKRSQTSEGIELLMELSKYAKLTTQKDRDIKAQFIWREFLMNDSPRWNCLDSKTYETIVKKLSEPLDEHSFSEVQSFLVHDLEGDLFFRFTAQCKRELSRLQFGTQSQAVYAQHAHPGTNKALDLESSSFKRFKGTLPHDELQKMQSLESSTDTIFLTKIRTEVGSSVAEDKTQTRPKEPQMKMTKCSVNDSSKETVLSSEQVELHATETCSTGTFIETEPLQSSSSHVEPDFCANDWKSCEVQGESTLQRSNSESGDCEVPLTFVHHSQVDSRNSLNTTLDSNDEFANSDSNTVLCTRKESAMLANLQVVNDFMKPHVSSYAKIITNLRAEDVIENESLRSKLERFLILRSLFGASRNLAFVIGIVEYRSNCAKNPVEVQAHFETLYNRHVKPNLESWVPLPLRIYEDLSKFVPPYKEFCEPTSQVFNQALQYVQESLDDTVIQPFILWSCKEISDIVTANAWSTNSGGNKGSSQRRASFVHGQLRHQNENIHGTGSSSKRARRQTVTGSHIKFTS